jgi:propionyl-CoA carboxylase beta chain
MSSKFIRTDIVYAWPTAEIAVMGAEGAVNILYADQLKREPDAEKAKEDFVAEFREKFANPYNAAGSGHIDEVLIPAETRSHLIAALELLKDKQVKVRDKKHDNMPL